VSAGGSGNGEEGGGACLEKTRGRRVCFAGDASQSADGGGSRVWGEGIFRGPRDSHHAPFHSHSHTPRHHIT
jgi:hypothetical protein